MVDQCEQGNTSANFLSAGETPERFADPRKKLAAGCFCNGPTMNCNNIEGNLYNRAIALKYAGLCFHTCHCLAEYPDAPIISNTTTQIDVGDGVVVNLPANLYNLRNRLNTDGAILGHGACFAGEKAGWTFEMSAAKTCCPGYSFNALTPQEAYMLCSLPYVSDIIAGIVTIGFCLKSASHL